MELGTGIFLSAVFLGIIILFIATKDRWNWKRVSLSLVSLFILIPALIGTGIWIFQEWENIFPAKPVKMKGYYQINLGMSKDEVMYVQGPPTEVIADDSNPDMKGWQEVVPVKDIPEGKNINDYNLWSYQEDQYSHRLNVEFNPKTAKVISIGCFKDSYGCTEIYGLKSSSSEEEVINRLGSPPHSKLEGVTKTLSYPDLNLKFYLTQTKVYSLFVSEGGN